LIASATTNPDIRDLKESEWTLGGKLQGKKLRLCYGDHHVEMGKIAESMAGARDHALNDVQKAMHSEYVKAFHDGSMFAHLESQRRWIKDINVPVECNIGFIETYRDPHGIRGEWEGFAAMINKERTKAFTKLVESAPTNVSKLPWPEAFEKDKFLSPDFTSLEVLSFGSSGIPAGE
jgi:dipeptidyl-peptidase-3